MAARAGHDGTVGWLTGAGRHGYTAALAREQGSAGGAGAGGRGKLVGVRVRARASFGAAWRHGNSDVGTMR